ncbi:hypothetical protein B484DRAFT_426004, partial [Ochromonadaceae sp. CCMP2298]
MMSAGAARGVRPAAAAAAAPSSGARRRRKKAKPGQAGRKAKSNAPETETTEPPMRTSNSRFVNRFWTKSAMARHPASTWGTTPKRDATEKDDGLEVIRKSTEWLSIDEHNCTHGRMRIQNMLGKLRETPAPGEYTPKIDFLTKREQVGPPLTFGQKPYDDFQDKLEDLKKMRVECALFARPSTAPAGGRRSNSTGLLRIGSGQFADVNIDDLRNSLLPGPGTYDCNWQVAEKFERPVTVQSVPRHVCPLHVPNLTVRTILTRLSLHR